MLLENNLRSIQHIGIPTVDIRKSVQWYQEKLDFHLMGDYAIPTPGGDVQIAFLEKDGLVLEFYQLVGEDLEETRRRRHGHIDHITLDVLDVRRAMETTLQRGANLDAEYTPDGPVEGPQYWTAGVSYVFVDGPNGERIELNQRNDLPPGRRSQNIGGWSHLGIPVTDIESSKQFYQRFGFALTMDVAIPSGEETVRIAMLEKDGFTLEFYQLTGDARQEVGRRSDGYIDHFTLEVADIESAFYELNQAGITPLSDGPIDLPVGERGVRYFFVRGPQGEKIEFNQRL